MNRGRDSFEGEQFRRDTSTSPSAPGRRPTRPGSSNPRDASPFQRAGQELSEEEKQQYSELLDHFGGDEEALRAAIEDFMEEYSRDPERFEALMREEEAAEMMRQSGGGGASRSPTPTRR